MAAVVWVGRARVRGIMPARNLPGSVGLRAKLERAGLAGTGGLGRSARCTLPVRLLCCLLGFFECLRVSDRDPFNTRPWPAERYNHHTCRKLRWRQYRIDLRKRRHWLATRALYPAMDACRSASCCRVDRGDLCARGAAHPRHWAILVPQTNEV
jgi:hypothetical protein